MVDVNNPLPLARHLDLVAAEASLGAGQMALACEQARALQAAALCVPGAWVGLARARLEETPVKVCALISFPLGLMAADVKRYEIEAALDEGAQEFEVTANHALLRDSQAKAFVRELRDLVEAAEERPVKVAIRPELLAPEEVTQAAHLCVEGEVPCLTLAPEIMAGMNLGEEVRRLQELFSGSLFIKAALPTANRSLVVDLLAAGAMRVGVRFSPTG